MSTLRAPIDWMSRSPWRAFLVIFLLAFAIRLFLLSKVSERHILPHDRWEINAVAIALVESGRFADPYMVPTGPTAHLPPIVPGIIALIWGLFGLGLAGGYAGWIFVNATYSAMYGLLPWFGGKLGLGRQAGTLAGIAGAFWAQWPGHGESLTAIVMGLLAIAFTQRWTRGLGSTGASFLLGLASGAAFHLQPVLLPVVLGWMAFELWWSSDRRKWSLSIVMTLGMIVACLPWGWRNYRTFDEIFFIRSNLGLELRMGNHDGAAAAMDVMDMRGEFRHPRTHEREALLVREWGETEYMKNAKAEALAWIRDHPGEFSSLTISRAAHWWLGPLYQPELAAAVTGLTILALLGGWRSLLTMSPPQRAALITILVCYPLIYYVVAYMPRYRVPIDWVLLMLAGAEVWRWIRRS